MAVIFSSRLFQLVHKSNMNEGVVFVSFICAVNVLQQQRVGENIQIQAIVLGLLYVFCMYNGPV